MGELLKATMDYIKAAYKITDDVNDVSPAFDGTFILLLVFAFAVRLFQSFNTQIIQIDSYTIIEIAKAYGNLRSITIKDFAVNVHPLFPFLMALLYKCGIGYEAAGRALSVLFGTLTVFPVYLISKDAYGRKVGHYSAFLFAIHPYLFVNASNVLRDSMSIFFIVMTFFIAWKGLEETKDRYLVLSGCMAALAYLTKAEGLFCIVAVSLFIWLRDPRGKQTSVHRRVRSTISFLSISLTIAVCLVTVFSLTAQSFSLSPSKSFGLAPLFSSSPGELVAELKTMEGITTGLTAADMGIAFFLEFLEAIFTVFVFLLGLNIVRIWSGKSLLDSERYYLFIVITLLGLNFVYFSLFHLFSRRYFLSQVVLLMGFMGYGLRLLEARIVNLINRRNGSTLALKAMMSIFVIAMIATGLVKGSFYWESKRASLKIAGHHILSRTGAGKTILTDDPRIAYYADGSYRKLTENSLIRAIHKTTESSPYDFIVFSRDDSFSLYEKYRQSLANSGFIACEVLYPDGTKNVVVVKSSGQ